jgi:hypothetical protein
VIEETQEEEGAALFPLGHALNLLHVTLASLDVRASLYKQWNSFKRCKPGNTKGGVTIVPLTSCLTGLESAV